MQQVGFNISLPIKIAKKKKWYLASCPILDIHSQGDTEKKAKDNLCEAISLFITSCFERGVLDEVLKSCGFIAGHHIQAQDKQPAVKKDKFINVPIPFLVNQTSRTECHA
jgi:predicted RNase H-like HicB family nuclease